MVFETKRITPCRWFGTAAKLQARTATPVPVESAGTEQAGHIQGVGTARARVYKGGRTARAWVEISVSWLTALP